MDPNAIEIILVEDNPDDAALTKRAFKNNKISNSFIHLKNGEEALEFIFEGATYEDKKFSTKPKIILLDLKMPKVNGMEVLEKIKSHPDTKDIPVVVLTSSAEDPDIKRCYDLGANSYIVKPVEFEKFTKTVVDLGLYWLVLNISNK
ncbi:MAG: response regulator [Bacteroidetes bacterium]|nr:response regulator [Bacteroidota bacterium]